jgi:hypothetical protein
LKPPQIFQHEFLQNFSINMFCKVWTIRVAPALCSVLVSDVLVLFYPPIYRGDDYFCLHLTTF